MPDQVKVGEAVVDVVANTDKLNKNVAAGKKKIASFTDTARQAGAVFVGVFAVQMVNAVKNFARDSVSAYLKSQRSLSRLIDTARRYGDTQVDLAEKAQRFLDITEATTRFSDTEAADAVNNAIIFTKDFATATRLATLAMDLSEKTGKDLNRTMKFLGEAFTGDAAKVRTLGEKIGLAGEDAKDAKTVFAELEKQFSGAAKEATDLEAEISKLSNALGNLGKDIVGKTSPAMGTLTRKTRAVVEGIRADMKGFATDMAKSIALGPVAQINALVNAAKRGEKKIKDLEKAEEARGEKLSEIAAKNQAAIEEEVALQKRKEQASIDAIEAWEKAADDALAKEQELEAALSQTAATMAAVQANAMQPFFASLIEGNKMVIDSFKELGRAMLKSIVSALGDSLIQKGAAKNLEALASVFTPLTAAQAPGLFAAGALLTSGGAGLKALAASLRFGGVTMEGSTTQDTIPALLRKNEVVAPLDDPRAMRKIAEAGMGGASIKNMNVSASFPGVRTASEANRAGQAFGLGLLKELQRVNTRQGLRTAGAT